MKRFMTGACWSAAPKGLVSVLTGLIACAWGFGIAPLSAHAQGLWGYGSYGWYGQSVTVESELIPGAKLFGLPMENGRVKWPVGLWLLVSDESEGSRDQLELAMNYATRQAAGGRVNRVAIASGLDAAHDLRRDLRANQGMMSPGSYAEAVRFLNRAERGFTRMKKLDSSLRGGDADNGTPARRAAPVLRGERRHSEEYE